ncbi:MAG: hypothetical protein HY518_02535 [Candidatus Aenigmarchaeota archaeon]|nr:hypothetical protein [Candidatus Aenigmarchaeota archaeon]
MTEPRYSKIPRELVGRDAALREGTYSDAYLARINAQYPLGEILGERKAGIANGSLTDLFHFTMGSPLNVTEAENTLSAILYSSANKDLWQPWIINGSKLDAPHISNAAQFLEAVEKRGTYRTGMVDEGPVFGTSLAKIGGFVYPTLFENNVIIMPSQKFVDYCALRSWD